MPYSNEDITNPFWAEYSANASGRDPLAIQNSSVVIYTKMMVGITNVTNRIRYIGFYCWLIRKILVTIPKRNSFEEQIKFIRRAELLLAYIMVRQFPNITGVSGSAYPSSNISSRINLINGADLEMKKRDGASLYWQFNDGIFGQYYSGIVREFNLINHPQGDLNIYTLTIKGEELGRAFEKNIPKEEIILFWNFIFKGSLIEANLQNLQSFALHIIPKHTDELRFYENMLMTNDDRKLEPTFHRQNTINLLLKFLKINKDGVENLPLSFLRYNYNIHINLSAIKNDTSTSWYLFEINELLHVAFEHFHACFLYSIETYPTLVEENIKWLIKESEKAAKSKNLNARLLSLNQLVVMEEKKNQSVYKYYENMESAFKGNNYGDCLLNATRTLVSVFNNCKMHLNKLNHFAEAPENNFNRPGYVVQLMSDLIISKLELPLTSYIKEILFLAINHHTFSSYTKTKIGQNLVHNYLIENDTVRRLRQTKPSRTTPRLQNAIQFITDIGWVKKSNKTFHITNEGIKKIIS